MKKFRIGLFVVLSTLFGAGSVLAADGLTSTQQVNLTVGGSSLIRAFGATPSLSLDAGATEAGQSLMALKVSNTTRLRISSLTSMSGTTEVKNKITASITTGSLYQTHTQLFLRLKAPNANFVNSANMGELKNDGNQPVTVGEVTQYLPVAAALIGTSTSSINPNLLLADKIGFCWSGTADDDGYVIEYTYASTNDGTTQAPSAPLVITYTIAADQ